MYLERIYKYSKEQNNVNADISKAIIEEIISNKVFDLSVSELAEKSQCSQPSVSRYIKNVLEVESYRTLVLQLNKEIISYFENNFNKNNYVENNQSILNDIKATLTYLSQTDVEAAAKLIVDAEKINVTAIGGNIALKYEIEHKLSQIGKYVMIGPDWHQQLININFMQKSDVLIAISYSGDKFEMNKVIEKANEKGIKVISLTGPYDSNLKTNSTFAFEIHSKDAKYRSFSFTSRLCAFAIWEVIFKNILALDIVTSDVIEAWKWQQN
ncbi:MurR/RpiR family transcriptional regulator [Mesoplasma seiffertii]|uniref:MurR/RpiR family transcriptional regulator n=1 Tax=Mesoplasma seiffertii TaxID=28224 RepID=UPI00047DFFDC|nr:SIS domain-containing protein [Mesoplasma seiffertii]